jgi:hypothetical protein
MSLKYVELPAHPLEIDRPVIRQLLGGLGWAVLMRSILMFEVTRVKAIRKTGESMEPRTLRSLWYTLLKPALDRLGALEPGYFTPDRVKSLKDVGKVPDWDGLASKYLAELVEAGITSYDELGIIDGSRQRREPRGQTLPVNNVAIVGVHHPNLLLFTEKDTIYSIVESIAALYGISVLSGSGQPSYAATENLIREMVNHQNFATSSNIYILTLTDYDPAGYTISQSVIDQVARVAATLPQVGEVFYERLGLEPGQLSDAERARNTYTPAPTGLEKWFAQTGGVDGQPLGLELDSLPISRIRELFVSGLDGIIESEKPYHDDLASALIDLLIWETLEPKIETMRENLRQAIEADTLIERLKCPADIVAQFAKAGARHIDPLRHDRYIFQAADEIRGKLRQVAIL